MMARSRLIMGSFLGCGRVNFVAVVVMLALLALLGLGLPRNASSTACLASSHQGWVVVPAMYRAQVAQRIERAAQQVVYDTHREEPTRHLRGCRPGLPPTENKPTKRQRTGSSSVSS
jgi:hypothetical protein